MSALLEKHNLHSLPKAELQEILFELQDLFDEPGTLAERDPEWAAELDRRGQECIDHPELTIPGDVVFAEAFARLRTRKAS